ncbi:MAG: hypothetical protein LBI19_06470 [Oscillospiraceae bacterium]|jgi:sugar lactone lactonase YvrE|nr:hypothetical protein [Oscillospiraceae bacterium]
MAILLTLPLLMGSVPYASYGYGTINDEVFPSLAGAAPVRLITGADLGVGALRNPRDFRFGKDGLIYLADTGNHRILVLDGDLSVLRVIDGFDRDGVRETFSSPEGVFARADGTLYIADTQNGRIVVLDKDGSLLTLMDQVQLTGSTLTFRPQKLGVDGAGRVYVVAGGSTEGLIQLTDEGEFVRFFGSNRVRPNPIEIIYRLFLTRTQRQSREQFVPTEYSNLHIDDIDLVYTTTRNVREGQLKRLNALGDDILLRGDTGSRAVFGDLMLTPRNMSRTAQFMSVCLDADENIYALDNATGKVFVYDKTGYMKFMFGGKGDQMGLFADPHAVAEKDGTIYVLDAGRGTVTQFRLTEFGEKVLLANRLFLQGDFEESLEPWTEVARMDAGYEQAWYMIGNAYFGRKDYAAAMEYFELGYARGSYSRAFGELRDDWLRDNFAILFILAAVGLIGLAVYVNVRRRQKAGRGKAA